MSSMPYLWPGTSRLALQLLLSATAAQLKWLTLHQVAV